MAFSFHALLPSCRFPELRPSLWPLYRTEYNQEDGSSETDILWPLLTLKSSAESRGFHVTPLFAHYEYPKEEGKESFLFYPLGRRFENQEGVRLSLFPLVFYSKSFPGGEKKIDFSIFPLLFMGKRETGSGKDKKYFALFPLGGTLHGWLNKDEIFFLLFPLFYSSRKLEYHSVNVLWPFFSTGWDEKGNHKALTLFPLYSSNVKEGRFYRKSILWPLFSWQENDLNTQNPSRLFSIFPLYGREESPKGSKWFFLWPFFAGASYPKAGSYSYDILNPLFRLVKSESSYRLRVWPFYSQTIGYGPEKKKEIESRLYLWPFVWSREEETSNYRKDSFFVLPFYYSACKETRGMEGVERSVQAWPLFHRNLKRDEGTLFAFPSPIPGACTLFSRMDELYWPYWNLYRSTGNAKGERSSWILFKLLSHHRGEDWETFDFPLFYGYHQKGTKEEHSFLLGLFRVRFEDGKKRLSLLYLFDVFL